MYFKVKPDCQLMWSLIEQSVDGTGETGDHSLLLGWSVSRTVMWFEIELRTSPHVFKPTLVFTLAVQRMLEPSEDPSEVVAFWGKTRVRQHGWFLSTLSFLLPVLLTASIVQ